MYLDTYTKTDRFKAYKIVPRRTYALWGWCAFFFAAGLIVGLAL